MHGLTVVFDVALGTPDRSDSGDYAARIRARTEGVFNWIAPWQMDSESRGRRIGARIEVYRHHTASLWRARERRIDIVFRRDGATEVTANPPYDDDPDRRVAPNLLAGAIDPTSALARLVLAGGADCPARTAVFDGGDAMT